MAATIKDVAKMADVSISTVSRVINDSKPVSPESRRRVLHAIEVLDYKPNEIARSLVTKKSKLIGVIVEDIGRTYVSQVLRGVEEVARIYDYDILLTSSYGDLEAELKFAKLFLQKQAEGIIVISNDYNPKLEYRLYEGKIPYIMLNLFYKKENSSLNIGYENAIYNLTKKLIEKNHKDIALFLMEKDLDRTNEILKRDGYRRAMDEASLNRIEEYTVGISKQDVENSAKNLVEMVKQKKITAVIATHDLMAIHLINLLLDNGIYVPKDVSVAGFGGSEMGKIYRPQLTTVNIPYYDFGAVAIRKILKKIASEDEKTDVELQATIIEGQSTRSL